MISADERDALILTHRKLVRKIAYKLKAQLPSHVDIDELVSHGNVLLVEWTPRYDPARGMTFKNYIYNRIRWGILEAIRSEDHVPRSARKKAAASGSEDSLPKVFSIDETLAGGWEHDRKVKDRLEDRRIPDIIDHVSKHEFPRPLIESLPKIECTLLIMCFRYSYTAKRAAQELGFSASRACQIRASLLEHAKRWYLENGYVHGNGNGNGNGKH